MHLVTGATGRAGLAVVRALLDRGADVRAFVRDADRARSRFGDAAELAVGDLADARAVGAALAGVEVVVLSGPDDPRRVAWETGLIDAAATTGVRRIVKLSSIVAEPGSPVAFWDWHGRIEAHLRGSGIPAVILRSSFYMTNLLTGAGAVAHEGRLYAPAAQARIAMIDPRDVGAVAAAVATGAGHDGRTYVLTGPQAVTYAQVATELAAATAREVEYVDVGDEAATQGMVAAGLPAAAAEPIVAIFGRLREGVDAQVTGTVEALTGSPPRSLATFAQDHAQVFAPRAAVGAGR